jgi:Zn-dependent protease with chaperone function
MIPALAAVIAAGIAVPHVLPLRRVPPVTAILLWLGSLALRALTCALAAVYLLFFLPRTSLFDALTHWCWDAVLPLISGEHGVEGHGVGDLAVVLPALMLAVSLVLVAVRIARCARDARHLVERQALAEGPRDSVIVGGADVAFGVAGLARPRIVVSAGALACLDDDELAAALDHERAHIVRRHRFVVLLGAALRASGRPVPGGGRAFRELTFHLERDADGWALRRSRDRLALASVLCKAAGAAWPVGNVLIAELGDSGVRERLNQLLEEEPPRHPRPVMAALNGLAIAMVGCTLVLATIVPTAAVAGVDRDAHHAHHREHCEH